MDGMFFLALNCLRNSFETELETAKHAAVMALPNEGLLSLGRVAVEAAERLGERRETALRLERCVPPAN